ncbi:PREDICTED: zonadhesin-like isoform X2 [Papilio polytes]|uniref:zonadhesin-like isoform X2 n=1 Tax=Papilio polytes TaxID=76194 RepID=UPI000675DE77|nr:PREDICTED: zonadhesin-like isoform X2 [Papilio polytes]
MVKFLLLIISYIFLGTGAEYQNYAVVRSEDVSDAVYSFVYTNETYEEETSHCAPEQASTEVEAGKPKEVTTDNVSPNGLENTTSGRKENVTCGDNEIFNNCPSVKCEYCPTCDKEARACLTASQDVCPPAKCTCRNNYRRLQNRTCVPTRECPSFKCPGPNEQFEACPVCPSDNCTRATPDGTCHFIGRIGIPLQCRPSCRCKENYWRDGDRCVPYEKCPNIKNAANCTRPNESLQCVRPCPPLPTCDNRNATYHCLVNKSAPCNYQCACDKGFYKNSDGFCVTNNLCDKKCNDPNAEYKPDKKKCPSDLCRSIVSKFACNPNEQGQPGCVCKSGFLRLNENSTCIPTNQCPEMVNAPGNKPPNNCSKPHESLQCVKSCPRPRTCIGRFLRYKCFNTTEACKNECVCDDGYYRNPEGFCVTSDLCDCTKPHESLKCVTSCPRPRTCAGRFLRYKCFNTTEACKNECVCDDGYYRNPDGFCVTSNLCDKKCTGPNEEYKSDKKSCPPEICRSIIARYKCDSKDKGQPGCACKPGFLRLNLNSTCIPTKECPELKGSPDYNKTKCTLPNESLKCVKSCPPPKMCRNRGVFTNCLQNKTEICQHKCICDDGYYRNEDGFCVTSALCDKNCTGPNEVYKADKKKCPPQTCQSKLALYRCDPEEKGQPGCVCKPGYLRLNINSTCIPSEQCSANSTNTTPLNCTLPNESSQCVRACPPLNTCDNKNKTFHCLVNASAPCKQQCACNKGFYRNSDGFCVTSQLCDKKCSGPYEVYTDNKRDCAPDICMSIVSRYACDPKDKGVPGCVCKGGYLRLSLNSTCIPMNQCPELANSPDYNKKCTKPNESLKCVKSCPRPRTCIGRYLRYVCPNVTAEVCENKCVCNDGYYRNPDGYCVTSNLCDKKCTGPNEEYKAKKKSCPPEICKSLDVDYRCNPEEEGQPGCACKEGYLRKDLNSTCIPLGECPEFGDFPDYTPGNGCYIPDSKPDTESYPVEFELDYWQFVEVPP